MAILSQTDWWTEHNINKTFSRFFFFLQQAEMSKAMQRTLFVNKSQTTFQDSNDHKRYISSPPPIYQIIVLWLFKKVLLERKKLPSDHNITQSWLNNYFDVQCWICLSIQETQEMLVWSLAWEDPWRRKWQLNPVFLPGKSHRQRGQSMGSQRVRHD